MANSSNSSNSNTTDSAITLDPDVAGPGVVLGFILTGVLATVSSVYTDLLRLSEDPESWINRTNSGNSPAKRLVRNIARTREGSTFWIPFMEDFVLSLSDQQLITGLLLVVISYPKYLNKDGGSLSVASDLIFFSLVTHFATLYTIRELLKKHPKMALIRVLIIFVTIALWVGISVETLLFSFGYLPMSSADSNALFVFGATTLSVIELAAVLWVFWAVCLSLFISRNTLKARAAIGEAVSKHSDPSLHKIHDWIFFYRENSVTRGFWQGLFLWPHDIGKWLFNCFCKHYVTLSKRSISQWLWWTLAEIFFPWRLGNVVLILMLILGLMNLTIDLTAAALEGASSWGFGQILPTLLIILPFFSFVESYHKKVAERQIFTTTQNHDDDVPRPRYAASRETSNTDRLGLQTSTLADDSTEAPKAIAAGEMTVSASTTVDHPAQTRHAATIGDRHASSSPSISEPTQAIEILPAGDQHHLGQLRTRRTH